MKGKEKCEILKSLRIRLAELNNISYTPHPCNNKGDCPGRCVACDAESQWLLKTLKRMEDKGFPVIYSLTETDQYFEDIDKIERDC